MPTRASQFYVSKTDQDQSWGTDERKLETSLVVAGESAIMTHPSAAGTTTITADPGDTRTTQGDNRDVFGWAINESGADGVGATATAQRVVIAGVWTVAITLAVPASALLGSISTVLSVRVYRVATGGGTRTTLFTFPNTNAIATLAGLAANGTASASSASQPRIVLEAGETIAIGVTSISTQVGTPVTGVTVSNPNTMSYGDGSSLTLPGPLAYQYLLPNSTTATLSVDQSSAIALAPKTVALSLSAAFSRRIAANRSGQATLTLTTAIRRSIQKAPMLAPLTLTVAIVKTIVLIPKTVALALTTAVTKTVVLIPKTVTLTLTTAFQRLLVAQRAFAATITLTTAFARRLLLARAFATTITLTVRGRVDMAMEVLNRMSGGSVINYIRSYFIMDE